MSIDNSDSGRIKLTDRCIGSENSERERESKKFIFCLL